MSHLDYSGDSCGRDDSGEEVSSLSLSPVPPSMQTLVQPETTQATQQSTAMSF